MSPRGFGRVATADGGVVHPIAGEVLFQCPVQVIRYAVRGIVTGRAIRVVRFDIGKIKEDLAVVQGVLPHLGVELGQHRIAVSRKARRPVDEVLIRVRGFQRRNAAHVGALEVVRARLTITRGQEAACGIRDARVIVEIAELEGHDVIFGEARRCKARQVVLHGLVPHIVERFESPVGPAVGDGIDGIGQQRLVREAPPEGVPAPGGIDRRVVAFAEVRSTVPGSGSQAVQRLVEVHAYRTVREEDPQIPGRRQNVGRNPVEGAEIGVVDDDRTLLERWVDGDRHRRAGLVLAVGDTPDEAVGSRIPSIRREGHGGTRSFQLTMAGAAVGEGIGCRTAGIVEVEDDLFRDIPSDADGLIVGDGRLVDRRVRHGNGDRIGAEFFPVEGG